MKFQTLFHRAVLLCTAMLVFLSGCGSIGSGNGSAINPAPYVGKNAFPTGKSLSNPTAEELLQEINRVRVRNDVAPLRSDTQLTAIALRHNAYMLRQSTLLHDGFDERFALSGSDRCAENIARGYPTAAAFVQGWLDSPEHRSNLLDPEVTHVGIALDQGFATYFACRRRTTQ